MGFCKPVLSSPAHMVCLIKFRNQDQLVTFPTHFVCDLESSLQLLNALLSRHKYQSQTRRNTQTSHATKSSPVLRFSVDPDGDPQAWQSHKGSHEIQELLRAKEISFHWEGRSRGKTWDTEQNTHAIWRARVPSTLARSYLVM